MQIKEKYIQSPLNYTGGKYKLLPQMLPLFPQNISTFVDLFCGGCNVAVNVKAKKNICNDIDENLIGLLKYIQSVSVNKFLEKIFIIIKTFNLSDSSENGYDFYKCDSYSGLGKYNKEKFLVLRNHFNSLNKTDENYFAYLYTLIVFSFNNQIRFNSNGQFNLPVGKRDFNAKMQEKLRIFAETLSTYDFQFLNVDFSSIDFRALDKNSFIYVDPPYLITCATYNEKSAWNEDIEKKLLSFLDNLTACGIRFALSNVLSSNGKHNCILEKWLKENPTYNCHHLIYSYKNSNYHKKNISKEAKEVLITNY